MSEHITHIAVLEDAVRLVLHAEAFDAVIKKSLVDHYDSALCASGTRGNHLFAVPLLDDVRQRQAARGDMSPPDRRLLAAALGWLVHRATDDILDDEQVPRLERLRAEKGLSEEAFHIDEHQIYEDAVMFREVYGGGRRPSRSSHEPLSPATLAPHMDSHPGASAVDVEDVELLFGAFWQRRLLRLQQFADREEDPERWMDTFLERYQAFSEDLRRYVAAFQQPDPEKMRYYVDEMNMYDASDPIIRLARALQQDEPPPSSVTLRDALTAAETQSVYAKALNGGFRNVEAAADYLAGGLSKDELYDRVGIAEHNRY